MTKDRDFVVVKESKKTKEEKRLPKLQEILKMEPWTGIDKSVLMNFHILDKGKKKTYSVLFNSKNPDGVTITTQAVPMSTQPTIAFLNSKGTFKGVFDSLVTKFKERLWYDDEVLHEILALGAMCTYFREVFHAVPYFDFHAAEVNCGKTTSLQCLILSSCYGLLTSSVSESIIFRMVDSCSATLGFDELDKWINNEKKSEQQGLINAGYKKGIPAMRTNVDTMMPEEYDAFGVKAFTHIKGDIPPELLSRSIVFHMIRSPDDIRIVEGPEDFREERDRLYWLRLNKLNEVQIAYSTVYAEGMDLINRDRERFLPLLTMANLVSTEVYSKILSWAKNYVQTHIETEVDDIKRVLVESLLGLQGEVEVQSISDMFHGLLTDYGLRGKNKQGEYKTYGNKRIMQMLSSLGILRSGNHPKTRRAMVFVNPRRVNAWATTTYNLQLPLNEFDEGKVNTPPKQASNPSQPSNPTKESKPPKESKGNTRGLKGLPSKKENEKLPRGAPRTFKFWLSKLSKNGERGFTESEIKKAHGKNYDRLFLKYGENGFIEQRGKSQMWWISDKGKKILSESVDKKKVKK